MQLLPAVRIPQAHIPVPPAVAFLQKHGNSKVFPFLIYSRIPLHGEEALNNQNVLHTSHQFFGCELLDISSSSIRRRIQDGKSIEYLTPPAVVKEINTYITNDCIHTNVHEWA